MEKKFLWRWKKCIFNIDEFSDKFSNNCHVTITDSFLLHFHSAIYRFWHLPTFKYCKRSMSPCAALPLSFHHAARFLCRLNCARCLNLRDTICAILSPSAFRKMKTLGWLDGSLVVVPFSSLSLFSSSLCCRFHYSR